MAVKIPVEPANQAATQIISSLTELCQDSTFLREGGLRLSQSYELELRVKEGNEWVNKTVSIGAGAEVGIPQERWSIEPESAANFWHVIVSANNKPYLLMYSNGTLQLLPKD